jgi:hypothetical protein
MKLVLNFVALIFLGVSCSAQQGLFVGKWQTRINRAIEISAIEVDIVEDTAILEGTIKIANPNLTQFQLMLLNPEVHENSLTFQTNDSKGWICHWKLTLRKNKKKGLLTAGCGEMLIEEKVSKKH